MNADLVTAATEQVAAVAMLHELNAEYIRAFVESDVDWYEEHLSEDFVCTLTDGRRIAKAEFLRQIGKGPGVTNVSYDQVDVQPLGEVALVHGVTHYRRDGVPVSTRYTDVWRSRDGRWQAVAAQLTTVTRPMSSDGCDRL
jgi:ketosteroid isomerase-like protein